MSKKSRCLAIALVTLATCVVGCGPAAQQKNPAAKATAEPAATPSSNPPAAQPGAKEAAGELPSGLPEPKLSGQIPLSVDPPDVSPEQARPWFDQFSWQSFIALNWPSDPQQRGQPLSPDNPETLKKPPAGSVTVWGSYKEAFELFGQGDNRPTPWDSYKTPVSPCGDAPEGAKMLVMANKGGTLLEGANEALSFPLIDQNKNYTYTEVRFNKTQYDFIRGTDDIRDDDTSNKTWLYLAKNLAAAQPIQMPASAAPDTQGALMVKATWRQMTDQDDTSRYYTVNALLYNPETKKCDRHLMGLVGIHIVQKLDEFPQWIWSSFEQVDNIERGPGATSKTPISFNNGTPNPKTTGGWANRPPAKVPPFQPFGQRIPVQVARFNPIPDTPQGASTRDLNQVYQQLLAGTVWKHYQLVITQWPTNPEQFTTKEDGGVYPQDCGQPFPVNGCVNVSLETYFQSPGDAAGAGGNSCISCHYGAGQSDFSWVLQNRAH